MGILFFKRLRMKVCCLWFSHGLTDYGDFILQKAQDEGLLFMVYGLATD